MVPDLDKLDVLVNELKAFNATLVAVSKTRPLEDLEKVYHHGHLDFGENYVQELDMKHKNLPDDVRWHFIGHLQSNKVKVIAPYVHLIHGIDSASLLAEVNKQALKLDKKIEVLLQLHIATEITKFGLNESETLQIINEFMLSPLPGVAIRGLMGMATFSDDEKLISKEFRSLKSLFDKIVSDSSGDFNANFNILSMGMTSDYKIALQEGSNMVRIGSAIFGEREKSDE